MNNNIRPRFIIEALFLRSKGNYGFREYFLNILNYLVEHSDELCYSQVIIVTGERATEVIPESLPEKIVLVTLPVNNPIKVYWEQNKLAKRFHLTPNDVIMFTSDVSALRKSCKHLLVIHDWLFLRKDLAPGWLFRLQRRLFVPRGARIADKIITISEWVKDDVLVHSKISAEKIVPIYNFLDFEKYGFGEVSNNYNEFCRSNKYFLTVSSGAPHKNLITLLKAYKKYIESSESSSIKKLLLVGSFMDEAKLYLEENDEIFKNNVVQLKNVSNRDLAFLYENASAFISPTLFEGFGMPIAEAMYFGIPVLVSDLPVIREITDNKAIYFHPKDALKLASLMVEIDKLPVSETAREAVVEMYSKENTVARYLEVINSMNEISV